MARTYTYGDIMALVGQHIPSAVKETRAVTVCNFGLSLFWNAYDWRESIGDLAPFWLVPNVQDYSAQFVPDDFQGFRSVYIVQLGGAVPTKWPLRPLKDLSSTSTQGLPTNIGYNPANSSFRVFPRTSSNLCSPTYLIEGTYKKLPTKLTAANHLSSLIPVEDQYYYNLYEVFLYAAMRLSMDPRMATQMQIGMAAVKEIARNEGIELGDQTIYPVDDAFHVGGYGGFYNRLLG